MGVAPALSISADTAVVMPPLSDASTYTHALPDGVEIFKPTRHGIIYGKYSPSDTVNTNKTGDECAGTVFLPLNPRNLRDALLLETPRVFVGKDETWIVIERPPLEGGGRRYELYYRARTGKDGPGLRYEATESTAGYMRLRDLVAGTERQVRITSQDNVAEKLLIKVAPDFLKNGSNHYDHHHFDATPRETLESGGFTYIVNTESDKHGGPKSGLKEYRKVICYIVAGEDKPSLQCGFQAKKLSPDEAAGLVIFVKDQFKGLPGSKSFDAADQIIRAMIGRFKQHGGEYHFVSYPQAPIAGSSRLVPLKEILTALPDCTKVSLIGGGDALPSFRPTVIRDIVRGVSRAGFQFHDHSKLPPNSVGLEAILFGFNRREGRWELDLIPSFGDRLNVNSFVHVNLTGEVGGQLSSTGLTHQKLFSLVNELTERPEFPVNPVQFLEKFGVRCRTVKLIQVPERLTHDLLATLATARKAYTCFFNSDKLPILGITPPEKFDVGKFAIGDGPSISFYVSMKISGAPREVKFTCGPKRLLAAQYSDEENPPVSLVFPNSPDATVEGQIFAIIRRYAGVSEFLS